MYVAVQMLYREGVQVKPRWPPAVGQLVSGDVRGVPVFHLWPLDWVRNASYAGPPLATLWQPVLTAVDNNLVIRGIELVERGTQRRWTNQKWLCDVLDAQRARNYLKSDRIEGALPSLMPPSPPPADPDNPFA